MITLGPTWFRSLRLPRLSVAILSFVVAFSLSGCGSGLSGEYADERGIMRYDFKSDGKVYISALGIEAAGEYEVDDNKVIVRGPNGNMVFTMGEDVLQGPRGMVLRKVEQ